MSCREPTGPSRPAIRQAGLAMLVLLSLAVGCESPSPYVEVRGTVTLDGKPLEMGRVQFQPAVGQVATAEIGVGGEFTLSTHATGDGVLPGTYRVTVSAFDPLAAEPSPEHLLVPLRYTRAGTSGLEVTIFPGTKEPVKLELVSDGATTADAAGGSPGGDDPAAAAPDAGATGGTP